jgi:DNA-binding MarR family transcriptional regulator
VASDRVAAEPDPAADDGAIAAIEQALHALARRLRQGRLHEHFARQAGVDLDQAGLAVLYVLCEPGTSLRVTDLAARLGIDTPGVTRKAQQLEREGLVSRCRDASDARASLVRLTPEGQRALSRFLEVRHQWFAAVLASWPAAERREFGRLVARFTDGMHEQLDRLKR